VRAECHSKVTAQDCVFHGVSKGERGVLDDVAGPRSIDAMGCVTLNLQRIKSQNEGEYP